MEGPAGGRHGLYRTNFNANSARPLLTLKHSDSGPLAGCLYGFPRSCGHSLRALFQEVLRGVDQPQGEIRDREGLLLLGVRVQEKPYAYFWPHLGWLEDESLKDAASEN